MTERHIAIAAEMYSCRATAKRLLGPRYLTHMAELATVVKAVAVRDACNDIVAGATVIKEHHLQGVDALLLLAAVVEMTEPTDAEDGQAANVSSGGGLQ